LRLLYDAQRRPTHRFFAPGPKTVAELSPLMARVTLGDIDKHNLRYLNGCGARDRSSTVLVASGR
jgi:hypothetical protein